MHPIAISLGNLHIYWYGILAAIGFMVGFHTASKRGLREGISSETIMNFAPWIIGGAIVGARALYVISYWNQEFAGKPIYEMFMLRRSGLVYYGGLIGSCLATIIYCNWKKIPLWKIGDVFAPSIALGHACGRIGCLMTGCCYGRACDLPWAIRFPKDHHTHGLPVHPVQIYEAVLNFAFYAGLVLLFRRKKFDGQVFAAYLLGYAVLRSTTESFRGDYTVHYLANILTPGQAVSVVIFTIGVVLWLILRRFPMVRKPAPTAAS